MLFTIFFKHVFQRKTFQQFHFFIKLRLVIANSGRWSNNHHFFLFFLAQIPDKPFFVRVCCTFCFWVILKTFSAELGTSFKLVQKQIYIDFYSEMLASVLKFRKSANKWLPAFRLQQLFQKYHCISILMTNLCWIRNNHFNSKEESLLNKKQSLYLFYCAKPRRLDDSNYLLKTYLVQLTTEDIESWRLPSEWRIWKVCSVLQNLTANQKDTWSQTLVQKKLSKLVYDLYQ